MDEILNFYQLKEPYYAALAIDSVVVSLKVLHSNTCLVPVLLSPGSSRSISFGNVSEANALLLGPSDPKRIERDERKTRPTN